MGPNNEPLSVDWAVYGDPAATHWLVVTSGLHGVEGPTGAMALELARRLWRERQPRSFGLILVHALNPFGFAWSRRWDHDGIDLNRNFFDALPEAQSGGSCHAAVTLWLDPNASRGLGQFIVQGARAIRRYGWESVRQAVAQGQYGQPDGLFFGGQQASWLRQRLEAGSWQDLHREAESVLHLDVHTGLGPWGVLQLFTEPPQPSERSDWLARLLDAPDPAGQHQVAPYQAAGTWGKWCRQRQRKGTYAYVCAEVGTYHAVRVLAALRREQQAWLKRLGTSELGQISSRRLREMFCPRSRRWRRQTASRLERLLDQAFQTGSSGEMA